jgi:hypothetical protein
LDFILHLLFEALQVTLSHFHSLLERDPIAFLAFVLLEV